MKQAKYTITEFLNDFPDDDSCLEYIRERRWPEGIHCEKCDQVRKHHRVRGRTAYACDHCGSHVYPLVGTIFEKSSTSLRHWFYAMHLMGTTRCGISAKQIQRETGVTYKTAWRMFKQIRSLLADDVMLDGYSVEVDESYFGGLEKNKHENKKLHAGRGGVGKTIVAGAVERGGRVIAQVIPDTTAVTLVPWIKTRVLPESTVYTDELPSYNRLASHGYVHKRVHHAARVYVDGDAHTNSIEGFWSLTKRGIGGVYHSVSEKYLQTYLNEYAFRYNRRDSETSMFRAILGRACGELDG